MADAPVPRHLRAVVDLAVSCGWDVDRTRTGRIRLLPPVGPPVVFGVTEGDAAGLRNGLAAARRAGLPVPHRGGQPPRKCQDTCTGDAPRVSMGDTTPPRRTP